MKKTLLTLSFLTSMCMGGAYAAGTYATAQPSTDENEIASNADKDAKTLTIYGKGDLSKVTVPDDELKVFSATGAGKVYTKSGDNFTAVAKGDAYDASASYYEPTITYGEGITPSTTDYTHGNGNKYKMEKTIANYLKSDETFYTVNYESTWDGTKNVIDGLKLTEAITPESRNYDYAWGTTSEGYYYFAVVKGTVETYHKYSFDELTTADYTITILTTSNRDQYCPEVNVITSCVDNLWYSSDATNYTLLPKNEKVNYTDGMLLYTATSTVNDEAIADNDTYFFTTHADYVEVAQLPFAQWVKKTIDANGYTTVTIQRFPNAEDETQDMHPMPTITNEITRALVNNSCVETLNLQDTYLASINTYKPSQWESGYGDPTFFVGEPADLSEKYNPYKNTTLKTLYMPKTATATISEVTDGNNTYRVFQYMTALKDLHLSEGIETLGENAISNVSQNNVPKLTAITFPNTLKTAKAYCLNGQSDILTLTFPAGMQSIERHAMWGTNAKDVYFLGLEAPKVAAHAWGESNYISNNAMTNDVYIGDTESDSILVKKENGVAVRQNYETQNGWYAMLHYPIDCSDAQAAKYTDLTRSYKKIVYGVEDETFKKEESGVVGNTQGVMYYYYEPGQETTTLNGKGADNDANILGNVEAHKRFVNIYPTTTIPPYGGNYDGGYEDYYVGSQYIWPSMGQAQRACIVAENCLLWNGVSSIGDGIRTYDSSFVGDGSEYIGLHQFVFTSRDVTNKKTDEWDMEKYADGKWHSICVPFDATKAQLKEVFGPINKEGEYKIRLCKFNEVTRDLTTEGKESNHITLKFNDEKFINADDAETVLIAHNSYMIWAKKEKAVNDTAIVLKNYVTVAGSPIPSLRTATDEAKTQYSFVGQYATGVSIPNYNYFWSKARNDESTGGFRFNAGGTATWTPYTSVVQPANGEDDYKLFFHGATNGAKISTQLFGEDNETTGIDKVTIVVNDDEVIYTNENVYNLNGQLVSTNGINGLAKGIYVVNGKKLMVK